MKNEKPLPLVQINYVTSMLGDKIWGFIDQYRASVPNDWDDRCYIPITDIMKLLMDRYPSIDIRGISNLTALLANWRRSKEIYRFDPEFASLLMEDADANEPIPYEALRRLPHDCLYIDMPIMEFDGFYVYFEYDTGVVELRLDAVYHNNPNGAANISLNMVGETIADGIEESLRHARAYQNKMAAMFGTRSYEFASQYEMLCKEFIPRALQLVLYLCAENAEVVENAEQKAITRRTSVIKDQYREIRKWDVGMDAGVRIRRYYTTQKSNDSRVGGGSHASPTPHMRRAHWHHFWTGKRDSDERKLVLRWIPPTFVAGDSHGEAPNTTINKV